MPRFRSALSSPRGNPRAVMARANSSLASERLLATTLASNRIAARSEPLREKFDQGSDCGVASVINES